MSDNFILAIETSCDETSAAVVRRDETGAQTILSNVVASQFIHSDYGGVVPELASREHLRAIVPVVREAMHQAGAAAGHPIAYSDLAAVAVTEGPGLAGALLVGITFAKSLAFGAGLPLIAVNHLEGHIHAVLMDAETPGGPFIAASRDEWGNEAPLLALVVSGGHTHLYLANRTAADTWHYRNVGKTLDDAAGEAYDKTAKLLGLPYPGGPWIDVLAPHGTADTKLFPFAQIKQKATGNTAPKLRHEASTFKTAKPSSASKGTRFSPSIPAATGEGALAPEGMPSIRFDLSFSGIKTAVRRYVELHDMSERIAQRHVSLREASLLHAKPSDPAILAQALPLFDTETLDLIASFQASVTAYLTRTAFAAAEHYAARGLLISGGVAANRELRHRLTAEAERRHLPIAFPSIALSTDNAAMIAAAAWPKYLAHHFASDTLEPTPQLRLG